MAQPYSLKDVVAALDPIAEWQPQGLRDLSHRLRWEGGWQGAGPLSYRSLERTVGGNSMLETFHAIDGVNPPKSLRQAYEQLGFPIGGGVTRLPDGAISLRRIARRVQAPDVVPLKFLSYNTYLLPGFQVELGRWVDDVVGWDALSWFGIPFGGLLLVRFGLASVGGLAIAEILKAAGVTPSMAIKEIDGIDLNGYRIEAKPALEARASELGLALSNYDICCLCEVFTQDSRKRIVVGLDSPGWEVAAGPDESGEWTLLGSGLFCLVKNRHIVNNTASMIYAHRGKKELDSDAWANKGVMLNIIDIGFGQLELFQTHFYWGGGIPFVDEPSDADRMSVWRAELAELADFYRSHHQPENVAIITGDFNMNGANVRTYAEVRRVMDSLSMRDLWAWDIYKHDPSAGLTSRYTDGPRESWDRIFADACSILISPEQSPGPHYCDDGAFTRQPQHPNSVARFDYIFAESPTTAHRYNLEVSRILRRPFRRQVESEGETYLSDHLALDLTLYLSPR